ncbi:hypothetical protein CBR_g24073 [Chara braunii]|uniref:Uncharacterized protein n=1 Tax=Chara braunii TaxID=69332 RepID=A0A388L5P6_CHABU|nr:hypothetical protein CBR_g24073 [Chara braunii]|eukprot:GBG77627.1 hypothetical protein CBR_g24073 [Chara braunii]
MGIVDEASMGEEPRLERSFRGHRDCVTGVAFNRNMKQLISCSLDGCVMVWNFKPQLRAFRYGGHKAPVCSVAFSPCDELIASGSRDQTVRIWVPTVQGKSTVIRAHSGTVRTVSFSGNGRFLLSGSDDKTLKVWSMHQRGQLKFRHALIGHINWVKSADFSPDGRLAVSGGDDKTVRIWDVEGHQCLHAFDDHYGIVNGVNFHPDGTCVASASNDHSIKIWDIRCNTLVQHYGANRAAVNSVNFHPCGNFLVSSCNDASLKVWDLREGHLFYTLNGHEGAATCATFSPSGDYFASGGADEAVLVWRASFDRCMEDYVMSSARLVGQRDRGRREQRNSNIDRDIKPPNDCSHIKGSLRQVGGSHLLLSKSGKKIMMASSAPSHLQQPSLPNGGTVGEAAATRGGCEVGGGEKLLFFGDGPDWRFSRPTKQQAAKMMTSAASNNFKGSSLFPNGVCDEKVVDSTAQPLPAFQPARGLDMMGDLSSNNAATAEECFTGTLQRMVGQMDVLTQTIALIEERMTINEDKMRRVEDKLASILDHLVSTKSEQVVGTAAVGGATVLGQKDTFGGSSSSNHVNHPLHLQDLPTSPLQGGKGKQQLGGVLRMLKASYGRRESVEDGGIMRGCECKADSRVSPPAPLGATTTSAAAAAAAAAGTEGERPAPRVLGMLNASFGRRDSDEAAARTEGEHPAATVLGMLNPSLARRDSDDAAAVAAAGTEGERPAASILGMLNASYGRRDNDEDCGIRRGCESKADSRGSPPAPLGVTTTAAAAAGTEGERPVATQTNGDMGRISDRVVPGGFSQTFDWDKASKLL